MCKHVETVLLISKTRREHTTAVSNATIEPGFGSLTIIARGYSSNTSSIERSSCQYQRFAGLGHMNIVPLCEQVRVWA